MYIVLLGAPGSGKGTVGEILSKDLNLEHISTGDMFRENLKNNTELGKQAKVYIDKGELVPDEITINMIKSKLADTKGAILDGFPRTRAQADSLSKLIKIDMALNIEVPFEEIIKRIENRRSCTNCTAIYNIEFNPPKVENVCDECGGKLYQREDQKREVVENRLEVYKKYSEELIEYYKDKGVLYSVEAGDKACKTSYDVAKEVEMHIKRGN